MKEQDDVVTIDLVEVFKTLWGKKIIIGSFCFLFTLVATIYAFTAEEQWTSNTEITTPDMRDFSEYIEIRNRYANVLGTSFDAGAKAGDLYRKFRNNLNSLDKRERFFEATDLFKDLSKDMNDLGKLTLLNNVKTKGIEVSVPEAYQKTPDVPNKNVSFAARSALEAREYLTKYINYINELTFQDELNDFKVSFNNVKSNLEYEKEKFEKDLAINKEVRLKNLKKASEIAKEANIKETALDINNNFPNLIGNNSYLFILGQDYLNAQIDVIEKRDIVFPDRYYQVQYILDQLAEIEPKFKTAKIQTFHYISTPELPVKKDKPKKALIMAGGLFVGLIFGCIFVLLRKFIKDSKKKAEA